MDSPAPARPVRVDVWSDVVCPFCWIGKRHLEEAAARAGVPIEVTFRAFQLNPELRASRPLSEYLAARFGGPDRVRAVQGHVTAMGEAAGLQFHFDQAVSANTLAAHRLLRHATERGLGSALMERLHRAHFVDGADLADHATLAAAAADVGLDAADARRVLATDAHAEDARADHALARELGVGGVPFFVFDGQFAVSGAQPVDAFVRALERARAAPPRAP